MKQLQVSIGSVPKTETISKTIENAQQYLFEKQLNDEYWVGGIILNPSITAQYILLRRYLREPQTIEEKRAIEYLLRLQNPDGSWSLADEKGEKESLSCTTTVVLALKIAGIPPDSFPVVKAQKYISSTGGLDKAMQSVDPVNQFFHAIFGEYPWEKVITPPIELLLIPDKFPISPQKKLPYWIWESIPQLASFMALNKGIPAWSLLKKKALIRAEAWILEHQLKDGSWSGTFFPTAISIIALLKMGYDAKHPRIAAALKFLDSLQNTDGNIQHFRLPVWDSALSIMALRESSIFVDHPKMINATRWLVKAQTPSGGWTFSNYKITYPDVDDTSFAIISLLGFEGQIKEARNSINSGIRWLIGMQNKDGGWPTFHKNFCKKNPGAIPSIYDDPKSIFIDPSVADTTAHALTALGKVGYDISHTSIKKAISFLKKDQLKEGCWYGRWGICYTYTTGAVLVGLKSVGESMEEEYVQKVVNWLKEHQNTDGGWGESYKSFFYEKFAGIGESTAEQTAWSLMGLLSAGEDPDSQTVMRGIRYLTANQGSDGRWKPAYTAAAFDPYINTLYSSIFPLMALGMFKRIVDNKEKK
jgi:squalene-hopene/tetraprenyl-beta-curcumene cyclase